MADDPRDKTGAGVGKAAEAAKSSGAGDVAGKAASVVGSAAGAAASAFEVAMGAGLGSPALAATGAAGLVGAGGSIVGEVAGGAVGSTAAKVGGAASSASAIGSSAMAMAGAARSGSSLGAVAAATGMAGGAAGLTGLAGGPAAGVASKVGNMAALAGKAVAVGALAKAFVDARRAVPVAAPPAVPTSAPVPAPAAPSPQVTPAAAAPAAGGGSVPAAATRGLPATLPEPPAVPAVRDPDAPLFKIDCKAIPSSARVVSLQGSEAMSRPYAFEVRLQMEKPLSAEPFLEMKEVVNERATLTFFDLEERERGKIHGQIAAIELLEGLQDDLLYRAVLVPKIASLGRNRRSCVYVGKTFPEILHEVLDKLNGWKEGEDYELALQGGYDSPLDQVCQYKESDLHFLTRLMEGEGVYYFFEQGKEREKVVIADHKQRHTTLAKRKDGTPGPAPKLYEPRSPTDRGLEESFWAFRERHTGGAGVAVSGYDYLNPLAPVESEAAGDDGPTLSFPDENVKTSEQAKHQATIRQEERVRVGKTTCESGSDIGSSVNWTRPVR
jgi:hypothetical protein